ncbi:MAG: DUF3859 domain-containing protein [Gammaproteobacteria bacterium]|nr:DUF3859 domain-containing protein [Gammaproteobacteria bacterium]
MKKIIVVTLMFLLSACDSSNEQVLSQQVKEKKEVEGRVLQYGLYTLVRGGEVVDDPKSTTGKGVSKPVITRDRTVERIPLVRDKYMAYQYRLSNLPEKDRVKLRRVLKHPEFILPNGTTSVGSDFMIIKKLDRGKVFAYDAYALNEEYEMVEGEWVFQIWYKGNKLVEQKFTTYRPDEAELAKLTAPSWLDTKPISQVGSSDNDSSGEVISGK